MKCPNCGAEIGNSKTCSFCGSNITAKMLREQEQLNMKGCPSCGSTNIQFRRENQGEIRGKSAKQVIYRTVGFCKDCGTTWYPNQSNEVMAPLKPRKTWLWVLGWIFVFPLPLTILMLRKKEMKPLLKYGIIVIGWLVYFVIASGSQSDKASSSSAGGASESGYASLASPPPSTEPTLEATEEPLTQYDVIDYFVELYNAIAEYPMTDPVDIDNQAPEHYRTEFRLNAYNYAIARQYSIEDTTVDIVLYGASMRPGTNDGIRIYLDTGDEEFAVAFFEKAVRILDPSLTEEQISSAIGELQGMTNQGFENHLTFFINSSHHTLMIDNSDIDFYKKR